RQSGRHARDAAPSPLARHVRANGCVPQPVPAQAKRVERVAAVEPVVIRPLRSIEECTAAAAFQREIWGQEYSDVVPATLLHVLDHVGGLAAGAFDAAGTLVGFVFGINGVR